jgi:hypothetical protein
MVALDKGVGFPGRPKPLSAGQFMVDIGFYRETHPQWRFRVIANESSLRTEPCKIDIRAVA